MMVRLQDSLEQMRMTVVKLEQGYLSRAILDHTTRSRAAWDTYYPLPVKMIQQEA